MSIRFDNRYDQYAYSFGARDLSPELQTMPVLEDGIWVTLDENGALAKGDPAKKCFILQTSSKPHRDWANGFIVKKGSCLIGCSIVDTDMFDLEQSYDVMAPLYVDKATGKLTSVKPTVDGGEPVVQAYVMKKPDDRNFMQILITA